MKQKHGDVSGNQSVLMLFDVKTMIRLQEDRISENEFMWRNSSVKAEEHEVVPSEEFCRRTERSSRRFQTEVLSWISSDDDLVCVTLITSGSASQKQETHVVFVFRGLLDCRTLACVVLALVCVT